MADEPTGNLDPENKTKILEILFKMSDANKNTLIMVTHDHELLTCFDRIIDFADFQKNTGQAMEGIRQQNANASLNEFALFFGLIVDFAKQ